MKCAYQKKIIVFFSDVCSLPVMKVAQREREREREGKKVKMPQREREIHCQI
jgi:hypothetical protein